MKLETHVIVIENAGYEHKLIPVARVDVVDDPDRLYSSSEVAWRLDPNERRTHFLEAKLGFLDSMPKDKQDYIMKDTNGRLIKYHGVIVKEVLQKRGGFAEALVSVDMVERLDFNEIA